MRRREMRPPFRDAHRAQVALLSLVLLMQGLVASEPSSESNASEQEDAEELLANVNLTTFKERYRRLIPYMTFYVANNYLQSQALAQNYPKELSAGGSLLRKPPPPQPSSPSLPQHSLIRLGGAPRRGGNKYRVNLPGQDKKFVPSVQYDPRNIGGDNDYFAPVRYATKITHADYYSTPSYQLYLAQKTYPEITTPSSQILYKDNRYFAADRPPRPPVPPVRQQHLAKKPLISPQNNDYEQDYGITARPPSSLAISYANKNFESLRYLPSLHANVQQHQPAKPSAGTHIYRKPHLNLHDLIIDGYQPQQLAEMLMSNKNNIDDNIKTLVEILEILHSTRQEDFPQPQRPPALLPSSLSPPPRLVAYNNYKPKTYTRPKVITETRFQVTPNPLLFTVDPERYNTDHDIEKEPSLPPPPPDHTVNNVKDEKVEYYVPYVQDISNEHRPGFRPTPILPTEQHSYKITEDLGDDILQDERYTLPMSTEASSGKGYVTANAVNHPKPKTSLKYGATRGEPHVDYPAYAVIPDTNFSCKNQRYKGFFGDPATGCQVWHYCDLNGGKSSFLCPNGTIFSQVALTCDWWFNVKCESTIQLYVLNERLYKYILPIMPKFPEDFTGPEVDRYLELKFKEMEAKMREKKLKKEEKDRHKEKSKSQKTDNEE